MVAMRCCWCIALGVRKRLATTSCTGVVGWLRFGILLASTALHPVPVPTAVFLLYLRNSATLLPNASQMSYNRGPSGPGGGGGWQQVSFWAALNSRTDNPSARSTTTAANRATTAPTKATTASRLATLPRPRANPAALPPTMTLLPVAATTATSVAATTVTSATTAATSLPSLTVAGLASATFRLPRRTLASRL